MLRTFYKVPAAFWFSWHQDGRSECALDKCLLSWQVTLLIPFVQWESLGGHIWTHHYPSGCITSPPRGSPTRSLHLHSSKLGAQCCLVLVFWCQVLFWKRDEIFRGPADTLTFCTTPALWNQGSLKMHCFISKGYVIFTALTEHSRCNLPVEGEVFTCHGYIPLSWGVKSFPISVDFKIFWLEHSFCDWLPNGINFDLTCRAFSFPLCSWIYSVCCSALAQYNSVPTTPQAFCHRPDVHPALPCVSLVYAQCCLDVSVCFGEVQWSSLGLTGEKAAACQIHGCDLSPAQRWAVSGEEGSEELEYRLDVSQRWCWQDGNSWEVLKTWACVGTAEE